MEKNATLHCQFSGKQANTTNNNNKTQLNPSLGKKPEHTVVLLRQVRLLEVLEVLSALTCHPPQSAHCVRAWKLPVPEIHPNRFLPVCVGRLGIRKKQHNVKKLLFNWIWWFICSRFRRKGWEGVMSSLSAGNTLHGHGHHCLPEPQLEKLLSGLPCLLLPSKLFNTNSDVVTLCVSHLFKFAMENQYLGETEKVCSD